MNTTTATGTLDAPPTPAAPDAMPAAQSTGTQDTRRFDPIGWLRRNRQDLALPLMFVGALLVFSLQAPGFLTADNLTNMARQSVYLLIVALGQLIVLIGGGLDLSIGMVVSLTSVTSATVMAAVYAAQPEAPWLAVAAGTAVGLAIGVAAVLLFSSGREIAAPNVTPDLPNAQMVQRFDSYLFRARRALPAPAQAELDQLSAVRATKPRRALLAEAG